MNDINMVEAEIAQMQANLRFAKSVGTKEQQLQVFKALIMLYERLNELKNAGKDTIVA